jgi:hypothetical protein
VGSKLVTSLYFKSTVLFTREDTCGYNYKDLASLNRRIFCDLR